MHSWFKLLLFGCLLLNVAGRPQQAEYNNDSDIEETEEEDENESVGDAYSVDDDDSRLSDKATASEEDSRGRHFLDLTEDRPVQRRVPADRAAYSNANLLSNVNVGRNRDVRDENQSEPANYNEQTGSYPKRQSSNRYTEANDEQQETQQHMTNRDVSKTNNVQNQDDDQVNKRTLEYGTANEEGDMIFEKINDQVNQEKNEYNANDVADPEQSRYIKQYYNTMQAENRDMADDKTHEGIRYKLRDRRETKEESQPDCSNLPGGQISTEINDKMDSGDEESAIKRHIKKLTSDELNQLLNSLTEEKRELLKKIIDDSERRDNVYINKREITKKAGAVEENNFIENCQSDLSKIQGESLSLNSPSSVSTEATEVSSKQQDSQIDGSVATENTSESSLASMNKIDVPSRSDESLQEKADNSLNAYTLNVDPKNQAEVSASVQVTSTKTENKREVNLEDLEETDDSLEDKVSGQDYSNDQGYANSQEENLPNVEEENQPNEVKNYKREAFFDKQPEFADSFKSLEESFPQSNAYDDLASYSGPLVRVKRRTFDQLLKKRSAGLLPDAKVAYFPYKAENDDEDNDEGNEFDDEGFYDRTSNFANNNKRLDENIAEESDNFVQTKNDGDAVKSLNENSDSNTSLGSDSDSVMSGVEGVDDNLMFSSGARGRRTAEDSTNDITQTKVDDRATSLMVEEAKPVGYQEHDAFGPLQRNSDEGIVRYKRIRRVKESNNPQEINFDTKN